MLETALSILESYGAHFREDLDFYIAFSKNVEFERVNREELLQCTFFPPARVSHITPHPDFRAHGFYNDVAVLKLAEDVEYTEYILPVCLPSEEYRRRPLDHLVGHTPSVIGWGSTHYGKVAVVP